MRAGGDKDGGAAAGPGGQPAHGTAGYADALFLPLSRRKKAAIRLRSAS